MEPCELSIQLARLSSRFWSYVDKSSECWTWTGGRFAGGLRYGQFRVGLKKMKAHRVSWILTNGAIPDRLRVCHYCDNPICVRPDHLFLGTDYDNALDRTLKGRTRNGSRQHAHLYRHERNSAAKITMDIARAIRDRRASGLKLTAIAREFSLSQSQIRNIATGKCWREEDLLCSQHE